MNSSHQHTWLSQIQLMATSIIHAVGPSSTMSIMASTNFYHNQVPLPLNHEFPSISSRLKPPTVIALSLFSSILLDLHTINVEVQPSTLSFLLLILDSSLVMIIPSKALGCDIMQLYATIFLFRLLGQWPSGTTKPT